MSKGDLKHSMSNAGFIQPFIFKRHYQMVWRWFVCVCGGGESQNPWCFCTGKKAGN